MPNEDFLDELPTTKAAAPAPTGGDEDMDQALNAAAAPVRKKVVKKLVRKVRPAGQPAAARPTLPPPTSAAPPEDEETMEESTDVDEPSDTLEEEPVTGQQPETDELQTLPMPVATRTVPKPAPLAAPKSATLPMAISDNPTTDVNQRWDEFLLTLEQATLIAVWELGVQSMTEFGTYSLEDLMKPRGRLTKPQATEVRDKLAAFGVQLSKSSRSVGSLRQGGGGQTRIRGLRAPARGVPELPADASSLQRRQHRMARNRLTM